MHQLLRGLFLWWSVRSLHTIRVDPSADSELEETELETHTENETKEAILGKLPKRFDGRAEWIKNQTGAQKQLQLMSQRVAEARGLTSVGLAQIGIKASANERRWTHWRTSIIWFLFIGGSVLVVFSFVMFIPRTAAASDSWDRAGVAVDSKKQEVRGGAGKSCGGENTREEGRTGDLDISDSPRGAQGASRRILGSIGTRTPYRWIHRYGVSVMESPHRNSKRKLHASSSAEYKTAGRIEESLDMSTDKEHAEEDTDSSQLRGEWLSQYMQIQDALSVSTQRRSSADAVEKSHSAMERSDNSMNTLHSLTQEKSFTAQLDGLALDDVSQRSAQEYSTILESVHPPHMPELAE